MKKWIYKALLVLVTLSITSSSFAKGTVTTEITGSQIPASLGKDVWKVVRQYVSNSREKIVVKEYTYGKDIGVCHDYALKTLMGMDLEEPIIWYEIRNIIENNFEISAEPKPGYLCVYREQVDGNITHTGIVCPDGKTIESKWGIIPAIFNHHVSDVPDCYGNCVTYFKPPSTDKLWFAVMEPQIKSGFEGIAAAAKSQFNIDTGLKGIAAAAELQFNAGINKGFSSIAALAKKLSTSTLFERLAMKVGWVNKAKEIVHTAANTTVGKFICNHPVFAIAAGTMVLAADVYCLYKWHNKKN